jgi:uracil-DNA glycosylase family 4
MIIAKEEIKKRCAFFPAGKGTANISDTTISDKDIMVLGQDWGNVKQLENFMDSETRPNSGTWKYLLLFLEELEIKESRCFYTNAIMGVRKGNSVTGKSPAFRDKKFIKQCQDFFLFQLELQRPKAILVLGKLVAEFLSDTSDQLESWNKIKNYSLIDSQNKQIQKNIIFKNGVKTNLVLLVHPSFRFRNAMYRKYKNHKGDKAEKVMTMEILK